jgi:PIN domain nuclease of toxin-antitoxin system
MNLLLDTHTYIWLSGNKPELSEKAKSLIENPNNNTFISVASLWEMSIKISLGKLIIDKPFPNTLSDLVNNGIEVLSISFDHILKCGDLPFHHRDPFDRLILAQCIFENMKLVSIDTIFDQYTSERVW